MAQRKYCAALLSWVRTTMAIPGDFPKPTPEELAELRPGPNGSKDAESSFAGLANDWTKVSAMLYAHRPSQHSMCQCTSEIARVWC